MAQLKVPTQPAVSTIQYSNLLGVDYQSDSTEISRRHSPDMVNMISDLGGNPIKRFGYRSVSDAYAGFASLGGNSYAARVTDNLLYVMPITVSEEGEITEGNATRLTDHTDFGAVNHVFGFKNYVYVLCEYEWFEYDVEHGTVISVGMATNAAQSYLPDDKVIPTVMTLYKPNGEEMIMLPAGTDITGATQGVNILTPWRRVEYCVTTETAMQTKFTIPRQAKMLPTLKVEVLDQATFEWKEISNYTTGSRSVISALELNGSEESSLAVVDATVTLSSAPYVSTTQNGVKKLVFASNNSIAVPAGVPNVRITYAPVNMAKASSINEAVPSHAYTQTSENGITITLSHNPHSHIDLSVQYLNETHSLSFTPREAGTKQISGSLVAIYDGNKTINICMPSLWRVCSETVACSTNITVGTPSDVDAVVQDVVYDVLISGSDAYLGFFRLDRSRLFASSTAVTYDSRLFASSRARGYYSRASTPFMIDDNYYFDVDQPIRMFAKTSSALAVIAGESGESPIYLARGNYDDSLSVSLSMPVYSITASNASAGTIAPKVSGVLNDEPIFLADTGLYGITTNYYSSKYSISRSGKINKRLVKEPNLSTAVGITHSGYFYLAVNTHMYVLDSRHRDTSKNGDSSYECYFFDNMPVITNMYVVDDRMYFTDGAHLYTWNDGLSGRVQYLDKATQTPSGAWTGEPVKCKWSSRIDDDGAPQFYKTLQKKGTMVTVAPPMQTSTQITLVRDANDEIYVGRFNGSTFSLTKAVLDAFTKKKVKKYKRLQFVVENNEAEQFGIISVVKSYVINNYAKR